MLKKKKFPKDYRTKSYFNEKGFKEAMKEAKKTNPWTTKLRK